MGYQGFEKGNRINESSTLAPTYANIRLELWIIILALLEEQVYLICFIHGDFIPFQDFEVFLQSSNKLLE